MDRVAIIGAGFAGALVSRTLVDAGLNVTVFEKSGGTGGRLSACRLGDLSGDLGAPGIEADSEPFRTWLESQEALSRLRCWRPARVSFSGETLASPQLFLGQSRNSALTRELLRGAQLVCDTRIAVAWPDKEGVLLRDDQGQSLGHFDAFVSAVPAAQAVSLLEAVPRIAEHARRARMSPCWVYMLAVDQIPEKLKGVDLVEGDHPCFSRLVVESNKPGRAGQVIKVEMNADWSSGRIEQSAESIRLEIHKEIEAWLGHSLTAEASRVHRWLYSRSFQPEAYSPAFWDSSTGIGACGDWIDQPDLEGSFFSAQALASMMLQSELNVA